MAADALERLGEDAESSLRRALADKPSLESRRRVERLLERLVIAPVNDPARLRELRAVEVLEHINTVEARRVLAALAKGTPEARLTREAQASLDRLAKRPALP